MQKTLSSSQIQSIESQIVANEAGARFLAVCECANCGNRDPLHDSEACRQADYIAFDLWRAGVAGWGADEKYIEVEPTFSADEIEEPEPEEWDGWEDSDEAMFSRQERWERAAMMRAMYA